MIKTICDYSINIRDLAYLSHSFSRADIAVLFEKAQINAIQNNRDYVTYYDFMESYDL